MAKLLRQRQGDGNRPGLLARLSGREKAPKPVRFDTTPLRVRMLMLPLLALGLTLFVELCNRGLSLPRLGAFVFGHPLLFLYNALIVLTTLSLSELFKRRKAVLTTASLLWVVMGLVQFLVVKNRTQPFCSVDILMLKDAFSLITIYFTWPQIIAMFLGGFLVVAAIVMVFAKLRKRESRRLHVALVGFIGLVALCVMLAAACTSAGVFPQRFDSLVDAYNDYGFATCFALTFGQQGISRPQEYAPETVAEILEDLTEEPEQTALKYPTFDEDDNLTHPNIVYVQLESFFDVNTVIGGRYSEDPTPWFNRLCERFPSGLLYVPTVGGGTANTEFEILSGLNLDFFGAGEYPYNTVLQTKACESVCNDLREQGYVSTAMHNNSGTFYSRNIVYRNLGFDRFVPLEYMHDAKYNAIGWAKDYMLTDEIMQALRSTDARDLIMCIGVESHGKYAETYEFTNGDVDVLALPEGIPLAPFQNFASAARSVDRNFLMRLIVTLTQFDEPTIVVAYGDHLPALDLEADMLTTGSVYASRYVIWNNFGGSFEAPDIQAYRLSASVMKQLGFSGGPIAKLHQSFPADSEDEEYLDKLKLLEYDMLYGDQQAFEGEYPYQATDMTFGSLPVTITGAALEYRRLLVTGENFNEFSAILVDGQGMDTVYIDSQHLAARVDDVAGFNPEAEIVVAQIARDGTGTELGRSEGWSMK